MKEIKAYIRCERALTALDALNEAGMQHATLTHVLAVAAEADYDQAEMNIEFIKTEENHEKINISIHHYGNELIHYQSISYGRR